MKEEIEYFCPIDNKFHRKNPKSYPSPVVLLWPNTETGLFVRSRNSFLIVLEAIKAAAGSMSGQNTVSASNMDHCPLARRHRERRGEQGQFLLSDFFQRA